MLVPSYKNLGSLELSLMQLVHVSDMKEMFMILTNELDVEWGGQCLSFTRFVLTSPQPFNNSFAIKKRVLGALELANRIQVHFQI